MNRTDHRIKSFRIALILVAIVTFLGFTHEAQAGHTAGVEITYDQVDSGKYVFYIAIYRDCNGIQVSASNLHFTSASNTFIAPAAYQQKISVTDVTGSPARCPSGTKCLGTSNYGMEKHLWVDTIDLSGYSDCEWEVSWTQCCRNENSLYGAGEPLYGSCILNKCQYNSSPKFIEEPQIFLCVNKDASLNFRASFSYDQGDSISYHLVDAIQDSATPLTYTSSYTGLRPLDFFGFPNQNLSFPAGFHLYQETGRLKFRPTTSNQSAPVVVEVREWRKINGVPTVISRVRRDIVLHVINCPSNNLPSLNLLPDRVEICPNDSLSLAILSSDADSSDTTVFFWDNFLGFASLTDNSGSVKNAQASVLFTPGQSDKRTAPYTFIIGVKDNACPFPGRYTKELLVYVRDSFQGPEVDAGPDLIDSTLSQALQLNGTANNLNGRRVQWSSSGDGQFFNRNGLDAQYAPGPGDRNSCHYQLYLELLDVSSCASGGKTRDTLDVFRSYAYPFGQTQDSLFYGDTLFLNLSIDSTVQSISWNSSGSGVFSQSGSRAYYIPSASDWAGCGYQVEATIRGCDTVNAIQDIHRKYLPINAGKNITASAQDFIQLDAALNTTYAQEGRWSTLGGGSFSSNLIPNAFYSPGGNDWSNCSVSLVWTEFPFNQCYINADTVEVNTVFTGLDGGTDLTVNIGDTIILEGQIPVTTTPAGIWTGSGVNAINYLTDRRIQYIPGTMDYRDCEMYFVWSYPYQQCSQERDTVYISFNRSKASAGVDQRADMDASIQLNASRALNGQVPGWWTTTGSGSFSDSTSANAVYLPGNADIANCGARLYWNSFPSLCVEPRDSLQLTLDPVLKFDYTKPGNDDSVNLSIMAIPGDSIEWYDPGTMQWEKVYPPASFWIYPSKADKDAGGVELLTRLYSNCGDLVDTLVVPLNPTTDIQSIRLNGRITIYPNPTDKFLHAKAKQAIQSMTILNMQGKILLEADEDQVNVSNLVAGMYLVRVVLADGSIATINWQKN